MSAALHDLPNEVMFKVFENMSVDECIDIAQTPGLNPQAKAVAEARVYRGPQLITNQRSQHRGHHKLVLSLTEFFDLIKSSPHYRQLVPQLLEVRIVRTGPGYVEFAREMRLLMEAIACPPLLEAQLYFENTISQWLAVIDARLMLMENPTVVSTVILLFVICALQNPSFRDKLVLLALRDCEIGTMYVEQWLRIFLQFSRLHTLDLTGVLLRGSDACHLRVPPTLRRLVLSGNPLCEIEDEWVEHLPPLLTTLELRSCWLGNFQLQYPLTKYLPKLRVLNLQDNPLLTFLDVHTFRRAHHLTVYLSGTQLVEYNRHQVTEAVPGITLVMKRHSIP